MDFATEAVLLQTTKSGCLFHINSFESKLSLLRDTLMSNEGIARSDHVSPPSILPEIIGRQASRLPTLANQRADGPRSVLGQRGFPLIGLFSEK